MANTPVGPFRARIRVSTQDYALCLREEKIELAVIEKMRGWTHSGFSVDQSVHLRAGDHAGIERLMQYTHPHIGIGDPTP